MCRGGFGGSPNAGSGTATSLNISLNLQAGRIGPIPVGIAFSCTIGPGGLSGIYLGAGLVANTGGAGTGFSPRASVTSQSGDPTGWGVRGNVSGAVGGGLGGSASLFATCLECKGSDGGTAFNAGVGPAGGASGSLTFGYRWK